jgi:lipopolysaccharide transport system permease protein
MALMFKNFWMYFLPWRFRSLIWQFARKDVLVRYRGSWLGIGWSVITPLAMLAIYTLVFQHVFKTRWPTAGSGSNLDFALNLYAGLLVFNWVAELLNRAPRLILEQPNLVTKVVFPLPALSWASMVSASFHMVVSLLIWLVASIASGYWPHWGWLALPLILLCLVPWLLALCWALSSVGVYLRDVSQLVGLVVSALMFLTPIFYPVQALPEWLRPVTFINPLTAPIEALRQVVIAGGEVPWGALGVTLGSGMLACVLGLWLLQRLQSGFADVL